MKSRRVILRYIPSSRSREFTMSSAIAKRVRPTLLLLTLFSFLHRQLGGLETDAAVSAIAERLVDGTAAAAKREGGLAGQIVFIPVDINQFDRALRSLDAERAIRTHGNFHLSHKRRFLQPYGFSVSLRKITLS